MKPETQGTGKDFGQDLKTFDQLPAKTKELERLRDQAENATGKENIALNKEIGARSQN